jgi:hypothetical protein
MTALFAAAMALLVVAVAVSARWSRAGSLVSSAGCAVLAAVGLAAALGTAEPTLHLGSWLGFGNTDLRADGLAGIFLALAGVTGATVSLAFAEVPPGRWLSALDACILFFVAAAISTDNAFAFFLAWEALTVCIYLLASADTVNAGTLVAGYFTGGLTKVGGAALLAAFGLLYGRTGSFALSDWARAAPTLPAGTRDVLFVLFVAAFGTKVGVLPLQGALPTGYAKRLSSPRARAAGTRCGCGGGRRQPAGESITASCTTLVCAATAMPSGPQAIAQARAPTRSWEIAPGCSASHSRTVPSSPALASVRPSGVNATAFTPWLWPSSTRSMAPDALGSPRCVAR